MKEKLHQYLRVRRKTAALYLLLGTITLVAGGALLFSLEERIWNGLSSAGIALAFIFLWTGTLEMRQTVALSGWLPELLKLHPGRFRKEELERCERENARYQRQRTMVLLLTALGIVLTLVGGVISRRPFTAGMGFGLCIQGAVLLVFNLNLHWHQSLYQHAVERFNGDVE